MKEQLRSVPTKDLRAISMIKNYGMPQDITEIHCLPITPVKYSQKKFNGAGTDYHRL